MKTIDEITKTMKLHHIASRRGYISRKSAGEVETYKGRFGEGYIILRPPLRHDKLHLRRILHRRLALRLMMAGRHPAETPQGVAES